MELLRAGANPSIKDKKGKTAFDHATEREYFEVAALLGGAWKKPKPKGGKTISIPCPALGGAPRPETLPAAAVRDSHGGRAKHGRASTERTNPLRSVRLAEQS